MHGAPCAVLYGVDDEVAQHALDPPSIDVDDDRLGGKVDLESRVASLGERLGEVDDAVDQAAQVDGLGVERGGAGVVPADLQQVGEQALEPVELRLQQLRRAS